MASSFALHSHAHSMSSLASTIIPIYFETRDWSESVPLRSADTHDLDLLEESRIPLPPSRAPSERGGESKPERPEEALMPRDTFDAVAEIGPDREEGHDTTSIEGAPRIPHTGDSSPPAEEHIVTVPFEQSVPLGDLIQVVRQDAWDSNRANALQSQVRELVNECAINARLIPMQTRLYRLLIDCFRREDKSEFASLYTQFLQLQESWNRCKYHSLQSDSVQAGQNAREPLGPWINRAPLNLEHGIVKLIDGIRSDPQLLARRISSLSSAQLNNLLRPHRRPGVMDTVLQAYGATSRPDVRSRQINLPRSGPLTHSAEEMQHDPMLLLFYGVFDTSSQPGSQERHRHTEVWSTTCAQVIAAGKPGSDDFCMTVLDAFATLNPWQGRLQLEMFLTELVETGSFILDLPENRLVDFTQPVELQRTAEERRASTFFDDALRTLICLFTDTFLRPETPCSIRDFVQALLSKIKEAEKRTRVRNFIISRWYCASFISNAIIYPESHGIMLRCHVDAATRRKIFQELAGQLQKRVSDALSPWKTIDPVVQVVDVGVQNLVQVFESSPSTYPSYHPRIWNSDVNHKQSLMLCPQDVFSIVNALYPDDADRHSSLLSQPDGAPSTASSVTGSSTLTSASNTLRTGTASSTAASVSGTSITSNSLSSEVFLGSFDIARRASLIINNSRKAASCSAFEGDLAEDSSLTKEWAKELMLVLEEMGASHVAQSPDIEFVFIDIDECDGGLSIAPDGLDITLNAVKELTNDSNLRMRHHNLGEDEVEVLATALILTLQENPPDCNGSNDCQGLKNIIETNFEANVIEAQAQHNFDGAHFWWVSLVAISKVSAYAFDQFLTKIAATSGARVDSSRRLALTCEKWLLQLETWKKAQEHHLNQLCNQGDGLRDKMWFVSDVKHSSTYEDARNVAHALRSMVTLSHPKQVGVTAWARKRLRNSTGSDRAKMQTLEVLAAPKDHGGPSKLSDDQTELTSRWLTRESIENFCKGEERIHRFCFEIQKCVNKLVGETLLESPVLWSSPLYQHEKQELGVSRIQSRSYTGYNGFDADHSATQGPLDLQPRYHQVPHRNMDGNDVPQSQLNRSTLKRPFHSSQVHSDSSFGAILNRFSYPGHVPFMVKPSVQALNQIILSRRHSFIEHLKETMTALLLSDLGCLLWRDGSETDRWISSGDIRGDLTTKRDDPSIASQLLDAPGMLQHSDGCLDAVAQPTKSAASAQANTSNILPPDSKVNVTSHPPGSTFSFTKAYAKLLDIFRLSTDPYVKLQSLYDLIQLATKSRAADRGNPESPVSSYAPPDTSINCVHGNSGVRSAGIPRTRLTPLEEVVANCEERRIISKGSSSPIGGRPSALLGCKKFDIPRNSQTDMEINSIVKAILCDSSVRPLTLFRDLQYIAAFVPSSVLDHSPLGSAYWTVGIAAVSIKSDLCKAMTHRANQIVAYHYSSPAGKGTNVDSVEPIRAEQIGTNLDSLLHDIDGLDLHATSLADAARLYTLCALEGDSTAARELALFHLTHPELVPRVTLPLSRPGEVFDRFSAPQSLFSTTGGVGDHGRHGKGSGGLPDGGRDPLTFAVAFHWMEFAANAGDADARAFLKENGELGRGW